MVANNLRVCAILQHLIKGSQDMHPATNTPARPQHVPQRLPVQPLPAAAPQPTAVYAGAAAAPLHPLPPHGVPVAGSVPALLQAAVTGQQLDSLHV